MQRAEITSVFLATVLIAGAITVTLPSIAEDILAISEMQYKENYKDRDKYAKDPYAKDPYAKDPYAKDPYAKDPYAKDPYA
ncbi:MAG: hypothetical protein ACE5SW_10335, partial [Nitrososphaeraceae archaeon]